MVIYVTKSGERLPVRVPTDRRKKKFVNGESWVLIDALDRVPGSVGWDISEVASGRRLRVEHVETGNLIFIDPHEISYVEDTLGDPGAQRPKPARSL